MTQNNPSLNIKKLFSNLRESRDQSIKDEKIKQDSSHSDYKGEMADLLKAAATKLTTRQEGLAYPLKTSDKMLAVEGQDRDPRPSWHLASQGSPWHDVYLTIDDQCEGILVERPDAWAEAATPYDYRSETNLDFLKTIYDNVRVIANHSDEEGFKPLTGEYTRYTWRNK